MVVDPKALVARIRVSTWLWCNVQIILRISNRAHVILPYHIH